MGLNPVSGTNWSCGRIGLYTGPNEGLGIDWEFGIPTPENYGGNSTIGWFRKGR